MQNIRIQDTGLWQGSEFQFLMAHEEELVLRMFEIARLAKSDGDEIVETEAQMGVLDIAETIYSNLNSRRMLANSPFHNKEELRDYLDDFAQDVLAMPLRSFKFIPGDGERSSAEDGFWALYSREQFRFLPGGKSELPPSTRCAGRAEAAGAARRVIERGYHH